MVWQEIGLPGGGPWRILENCPSRRHNTMNASRGKNNDGRCICPRGVHLLKASARGWEANRIRKPRLRAQSKIVPPDMPDLSTGACSTDEYRQIARDGQNDATYLGAVGARDAARAVCLQHCPVQLQCRDYILAAERPAGSWGGVWGGLDVDERKRISRGRR